MTMLKVTTTITTRVTTMITTTTRTVAELDSKMQYFAAMRDCSCLFLSAFSGTVNVSEDLQTENHSVLKPPKSLIFL